MTRLSFSGEKDLSSSELVLVSWIGALSFGGKEGTVVEGSTVTCSKVAVFWVGKAEEDVGGAEKDFRMIEEIKEIVDQKKKMKDLYQLEF